MISIVDWFFEPVVYFSRAFKRFRAKQKTKTKTEPNQKKRSEDGRRAALSRSPPEPQQRRRPTHSAAAAGAVSVRCWWATAPLASTPKSVPAASLITFTVFLFVFDRWFCFVGYRRFVSARHCRTWVCLHFFFQQHLVSTLHVNTLALFDFG